MILFKKTTDLHKYLDVQLLNGSTIGFVPTMGALHSGHISLIKASKKENKITVCSIFVNPAQFNDPNDFEKYPVTTEKDIYLLEAAGCQVLFLPLVKEIYPEGMNPKMYYDLGYLEKVLEGKFRPGHFRGVCMVLHRLLEIVKPSRLYLGQKDYQQYMVVRKLIELIRMPEVQIVICPTLREADGLAMSSRNMRLTGDERKKAAGIYKCLDFIKQNLNSINLIQLKINALQLLGQAGFKVDYIEIADANNLEPVTRWDGKQKLIALVAAFLNEVRLIDNMLLS